ncbi:hypothetical protein HC251_05350 [Iamia sp. SCSIO 61187]|uniref:RNA polymerase sigma factor n=1 Tax=Iamia sp. SCSIO 61187 TaxID=2722752 RepID=UPI002102351B|nr:hypothetical protein HC251_05350 [Iamia sp. SCSIO 61187]
MLAATVRVTRDLDAAEEAVQDAYIRALRTWGRDGVPDRPGAWLTTAARRQALDGLRRGRTQRAKLPLLVAPPAVDEVDVDPDAIPDDRLRLVFTCCHPALAPEAQVALTLRLVCGVATPDVARALLVSETTMAARITRAKQKIAAAGIPYAEPEPDERGERLGAVLTVVHLVLSLGHTAASGPDLVRDDLADRALGLARMLRRLLPTEAEVAGVLALALTHHARRRTRVDAAGRLVRLAALAEVDALAAGGRLDRYPYLPAVRADLLERLGRDDEAVAAYTAALALTDNAAEQEHLRARIAARG